MKGTKYRGILRILFCAGIFSVLWACNSSDDNSASNNTGATDNGLVWNQGNWNESEWQ
jgi:hypothetical protein